MAYFTPDEEAWALQVQCPICDANPQEPCDGNVVECDGYHIGRFNRGREVSEEMGLKNKRSGRSGRKNLSSFDPDEWDRKRREWDAELAEIKGRNGFSDSTTTSERYEGASAYTGSSRRKNWTLPPPKPWEWWETGLPGVFAGRQLLYAKDAEALIKETGITHVLDLREPKEWKKPYIGEAPIAHLVGAGIVRRNVTMIDASRMTEKKLLEAVQFVEESVKAGGKVYISCRAGKERTGTVLFAYAVRRGLAPEAAYSSLQKQCKDFRPMFSQMEAAFQLLKMEGVLPCYDCGRPLSVSPDVGMCRCVPCSKHFRTTSYLKVTTAGIAVGNGGSAKEDFESLRDAPPVDYCWNCRINFAETEDGICTACNREIQ